MGHIHNQAAAARMLKTKFPFVVAYYNWSNLSPHTTAQLAIKPSKSQHLTQPISTNSHNDFEKLQSFRALLQAKIFEMGPHLSSALAQGSSLHKVSPGGFFLFLTPAKQWKESQRAREKLNQIPFNWWAYLRAGILEISIKQIFTKLGKPGEPPISSIHPKNKTCKTHSKHWLFVLPRLKRRYRTDAEGLSCWRLIIEGTKFDLGTTPWRETGNM